MPSIDSVVLLKESRVRRQIVQPTWFNVKSEPFIDPIVHVDKQSLEMADMIRKSIQKAVNEGTYAVRAAEEVLNQKKK